jgi:hypothetical protein
VGARNLSESTTTLRARVGGLKRRGASPERIDQARRELRLAVARRYMIRLRDEQDLSPEQRASLAVTLLSPAGGSDAA